MPIGNIATEADLRAFVQQQFGSVDALVRQLQGASSRGWSPGDMKASSVAVDQDGWVLADGRAATVADYPGLYDLYVAAGYPYGRSGSDPRIPDAMGRALIGAGRGQAGLTVRTLGTAIGEEAHTLTSAELPANAYWTNSGAFTAASTPAFHSFSVVTGGGRAHNTMPPSLPVYVLVKV